MANNKNAFEVLLEKLRVNDANCTVVSLMDNSDEKSAQLGRFLKTSSRVESIRLNVEALTDNGSYLELLEALEKVTSLRSVELHSNAHGQATAERLLHAVAQNPFVERIELHHVSLSTHVLHYLLTHASSKKRVSLFHCRFLASNLPEHSRITAIPKHQSLYTLSLSRCHIVTQHAGEQLLAVLQNTRHYIKSLRFLATLFGEAENGMAADFFAELRALCPNVEVYVKDYVDEFAMPTDVHALGAKNLQGPVDVKGTQPTYQLDTTVLRLR